MQFRYCAALNISSLIPAPMPGPIGRKGRLGRRQIIEIKVLTLIMIIELFIKPKQN